MFYLTMKTYKCIKIIVNVKKELLEEFGIFSSIYDCNSNDVICNSLLHT